MPRAENRKRQPNSLGNVPSSGKRNKSNEIASGTEHQTALDKKQQLVEKMRKLQSAQKSPVKDSE